MCLFIGLIKPIFQKPQKGDEDILIVSTSLNVYNSCDSYEEGIKRAKKCGFKCYDLNCRESEFMSDNWKDRYRGIRTYADSLGVEFYQAHAHFTKVYDDVQSDLMRRTIEAAAIVGAKWTVIHPVEIENASIEEKIEKNIEILSPFIEFAKQSGVGVAVENTPTRLYWYGEKIDVHGFDTAEGLVKLCDTLNSSFGNVGICWDTGHANLSQGSQYDAIKLIGERLKILHIADNYNQNDEHMPPFYGNIDFNAILKALKEINYQGTFNFETHKFTQNLPDELVDDAVKLMYKIGRYWCDKMNS